MIGGWDNTKSVIRAGGMGPIVEEATTLHILDGDEFRQFWISWDKGMVQVGEGRRKGTDTFLRLVELHCSLYEILLSSSSVVTYTVHYMLI